jgi:hypothetical protein
MNTVLLRSLRALGLLTGSTFVRMLRESLVLRSMVWPGIVTCTTLAATLVVAAAVRPGRDVAVEPGTDPALVVELEEAGFDVEHLSSPGEAVRSGRYSMGTDGRAIWVYGTPPAALELESMVRTRLDADWRPKPRPPPEPRDVDVRGDIACRILALLFVLYGLVFGLGGVARDRDDGTLEAELSLPIPRFVGGLARWLASTAILALFFTVSVHLFAAIIPVPYRWEVIRHGIAAASVGVAIGLVVVGTSGVKQGFSGPFAAGMTFATGMASVGGALGLTWLPLASLFGSGSGWPPLGMALLLGLLSSWSYGWRMGGR